MKRDTPSPLTGRAALAQGTSGTGLSRKVHDSPRLEGQHHLVGALNQLLLPIQLKGRLRKARAIAHRPGLAVDLQARRTLPDPQTAQVRSINVQLTEARPIGVPDQL